jgi:hypothetical protein
MVVPGMANPILSKTLSTERDTVTETRGTKFTIDRTATGPLTAVLSIRKHVSCCLCDDDVGALCAQIPVASGRLMLISIGFSYFSIQTICLEVSACNLDP